jgi:CheY-like chemotaxis protein
MEAGPGFTTSGLRVLVCDDDPLCLKIVEHMLRRCNYEGALRVWFVFLRTGPQTRGLWSVARFRTRAVFTAASDFVEAFAWASLGFFGLRWIGRGGAPKPRHELTPSCCFAAVTTCPNGLSALEKLRERSQHYDLVLSDVYMPGVMCGSPLCSFCPRSAVCQIRLTWLPQLLASVSLLPFLVQIWTGSSCWSKSDWI